MPSTSTASSTGGEGDKAGRTTTTGGSVATAGSGGSSHIPALRVSYRGSNSRERTRRIPSASETPGSGTISGAQSVQLRRNFATNKRENPTMLCPDRHIQVGIRVPASIGSRFPHGIWFPALSGTSNALGILQTGFARFAKRHREIETRDVGNGLAERKSQTRSYGFSFFEQPRRTGQSRVAIRKLQSG